MTLRALAVWAGGERGSVRRRILSGSFWNILGGAGGRLLAVLTSIWVARILGREAFGQYGTIQNTVGLFSIFAGFGLGTTAARHIGQYRRAEQWAVRGVVRVSRKAAAWSSLVTALALLCTVRPLSRTLDAPHLAPALAISSLWLLASGLLGAENGILAGFEAFRALSLLTLVAGVLTLPVAVILTSLLGVDGAVLAQAVVTICTLAGAGLLVRNRVPPDGTENAEKPPSAKRLLWGFSLPATLSTMAAAPAIWITNVMLVRSEGGYAEMGLFTVANQWRMAVLFVPTALASVALPVLSDVFGQGDARRYQRAVWKTVGITALVVTPIALAVGLGSGYIAALYGIEYRGAVSVIWILAVSSLLSAVASVAGQAMAASGRMWLGFSLNAAWAGVLVLVTAIRVHAGAVGLAQAYLVSYAIHLATVAFCLHRLPVGRRTNTAPARLEVMQ